MKKAEMSVNIIVVIVIALLILVILAFLLGRNFLGLGDASSCPGAGGVCRSPNDATHPCTVLEKDNKPLTCTNTGDVCCSII